MYVDRNELSEIVAIYARPQRKDHEFVLNAELHNQSRMDALEALSGTDSSMSRFVEDLYALLLAKGIIGDTEMPQAARDNLTNRQSKRAALL